MSEECRSSNDESQADHLSSLELRHSLEIRASSFVIPLAMHPRLFIAAGDDLRFGHGEFVEAPLDDFVHAEQLREPYVSAMLPGLALEQVVVKRGQLTIRQPLAKDAESLARAGLDQPGHQQSIDGLLRLLLGDQ